MRVWSNINYCLCSNFFLKVLKTVDKLNQVDCNLLVKRNGEHFLVLTVAVRFFVDLASKVE